MKWVYCFLGFILSLSAIASNAQSTDTLVIRSESVVLVGSLANYYIDRTNQLTVHEINSRQYERQFETSVDDVPNFTGEEGTVWFRITVRNLTDHEISLRIGNPYIQQLDIYALTAEGMKVLRQTGFFRPFATRGLYATNYIIPLPTSHQQSITLYGAMRTLDQPFWVPLEVGNHATILDKERTMEMLNMVLLGIMLVMLFYNLVLYFFIRDIIYIYYVVYVLSAILYLLFTDSLLFEWFWPDSPAFNHNIFPVAFVYFALIVFANQVMSAKKIMPGLYRFSYVLFAMMVVVALDVSLRISNPLLFVNLLGTLGPLYVLILLIEQVRRKYVLAYLFLIGWVPVLAASVVYTLVMRGYFYYDFICSHVVGLAMAWEATVFSLVLGYRFNVVRQQKLSMERENIRIVQDQNRMLEARVQERTREIVLQNSELKQRERENQEQQKVIENHNRYLESAVDRRTTELEESNSVLRGEMHKLEQFNFIIAHNLRAPVARMLGLSNIFNRSNLADPMNEVVLEKTSEAAKDLDKVITDLGDILNLQQGQEEKYAEVNLMELLKHIQTRFSNEIDESHAVIEVQLGITSIITVPAYIDSILSNLISNSLKHQLHNRPPRILVRVTTSPTNYKILVRDNGKGFNREKFADKLFEPFQRFDLGTKGKGLGLFLVKTQAASLHGHVYIQSKEGVGTEVEVVIPVPQLKA